jgi:hypothetical protein
MSNRRAMHRLGIMPVGRLLRALSKRGLGDLQQMMRVTQGSALIGSFVLAALINADMESPSWCTANVDLLVRVSAVRNTIDAITNMLALAHATDVTSSLINTNSATIRYSMTVRSLKTMFSVNVHGCDARRDEYRFDFSCLDAYYDGTSFRGWPSVPLQPFPAVGQACIWRGHEGSQADAVWTRLCKYRSRGFHFDKFINSLEQVQASCASLNARYSYSDRDNNPLGLFLL